MRKATSDRLLQELLELHEARSPYIDDAWEKSGVERYLSEKVFAQEQAFIDQAVPLIVAHASELPERGSFLTRKASGRPLLLTRDADGKIRAFYNVCRHRGAQLVAEESGCKSRFSCPYHAWTYNDRGDLIGVPHEKTGFPGLDRRTYGLSSVACEEYAGWVWVNLGSGGETAATYLADISTELVELAADEHVIFDASEQVIAANWKILVEGGIESYHFRVAHRDTIAPLFLDNLSSYQRFGRHLRSVLPRSNLRELRDEPQESWDIRGHANVLYSLFPRTQFLVQEDHFVWVQSTPLAPDRSHVTVSTMIPKRENTPEKREYWQRNHELTSITLNEDFALGEGIQRGLASGANPHLNFGRFEGALSEFHRIVDEAMAVEHQR